MCLLSNFSIGADSTKEEVGMVVQLYKGRRESERACTCEHYFTKLPQSFTVFVNSDVSLTQKAGTQ